MNHLRNKSLGFTLVLMAVAAVLDADNATTLARIQTIIEKSPTELEAPSSEGNHTPGEQKNKGNHNGNGNNHQEQPAVEEEPALAPAAPPHGD